MSLFFLYIELCGKTDKKISGAIFNSMSLETKMNAVAALIKIRTADKTCMQEWDRVSKAFFKQKRLRDKLAHWSIISTNPEEDGVIRRDNFVAFLCPPMTDVLRTMKALHDPQNSEVISGEVLIKKSLEGFGEVNEQISAFRRNLPAH